MTALTAVIYSFLFGLLHGVLPDEHTWPITFSYAIGGASGREGITAGLFFSAAFTLQRTLLSEAAYLALAPFLLRPSINQIVYIVVGVVMTIAGTLVLRRNLYPHFHLLGHHHDEATEIELTGKVIGLRHDQIAEHTRTPPVQWTLIHGFIAGFGFGGFSLFVNTVAAPAMASPWLGFLPGLVYGIGTMIMLVVIGYIFGASMRWSHMLNEQEIKRIGSQTGGRTLFFGGLLFTAFGVSTFLGWERFLPIDVGYVLIGLFMVGIAIPAFIYSLKEVLAARKRSMGASQHPSAP
jgi:sulfite exporter TauE/SafE